MQGQGAPCPAYVPDYKSARTNGGTSKLAQIFDGVAEQEQP